MKKIKKENQDRWILLGFIGLTLLLYGVISAIFYRNVMWYSYFVMGGPLFFGYLNYKLKNESIFKKDIREIFRLYLLYFVSGIIIELIGRHLLKFWYYPHYRPLDYIFQLLLIIYPIGFFFIYESFIFIKSNLKSFTITLIITTLFQEFINEFPNTFVYTWRYIIPYIKLEILNINIVVVIGWVILIYIPLIIYKIIY